MNGLARGFSFGFERIGYGRLGFGMGRNGMERMEWGKAGRGQRGRGRLSGFWPPKYGKIWYEIENEMVW